MRKRIGISALALSAALAVSPAAAASLNLGGDGPLVDLGTGTSEPVVDVNLGNDTGATVDLGNDGSAITLDTTTDGSSEIGVIDLGDTDATIDLNGSGDPNDVVLDLDDDDCNDVIVDLFCNGADDTDGLIEIGEGGLIDLGGTDDEIEVNLGGTDESVFVDLFGDGEDAVVDLDALDDDELVVDILDMEAPVPATRIRLPDTDGLDLGDTDVGDVDLGNLPDIDLDGVLGGEVIPDLFGAGGSVGDIDLGDIDLGNLPGIDLGDTDLGNLPNIDIGDLGGLPNIDFGDTIGGVPGLPGVDFGTDGTDGTNGTDGDDGATTVVVINQPGGDDPGTLPDPGAFPNGPGMTPGSNTTTIIPGVNRATARTRVAQQDTKCFTPDDQQIANLVSRRTYTASGMAGWRNARNVTIVPVRLCPEARVRVSEVTYADANMAALRNGIAASPAIKAKLNGTGRSAEDVLAVDNKDGQLVVYIY